MMSPGVPEGESRPYHEVTSKFSMPASFAVGTSGSDGTRALLSTTSPRTFPAWGTFSAAQREIYDAVLAAQLEALAAVKPGATVDGIHELAVRHLTGSMVRLGLLSGSVDERIADGSYKRYYMHRTSHWLGMDVHDVGAYYLDGKSRSLAPGMVLTVEPGLYVAPDDEKAPERLRGLGVRIEDDVLVTADGGEVLTAAVPKTPEDVEACCTR